MIRDITEENAEAISSSLTIRARLVFLLYPPSPLPLRSSFPVPSTRLRRAAFVNFYAFLVGNVVYYQRDRELCKRSSFDAAAI